jgi:hypothetical protein
LFIHVASSDRDVERMAVLYVGTNKRVVCLSWHLT